MTSHCSAGRSAGWSGRRDMRHWASASLDVAFCLLEQ